MIGTVLANEEVINGLSERGNHPVIRQPLRQWVLKITQYADKLEDGLKDMQWPEGTLSAQKQWIGRSVGASIKFKVQDRDDTIEVFTTRPDTIMGVTYVVLAPESPLVEKLTTPEQLTAIANYRSEVAGKSDMERTSTGKDRGKTGVWTGSFALHPITAEAVPIWIADYVLAGYGTGAVMAVPAHDERDYAFAGVFGLPIKRVVASSSADDGGNELPMCEPGVVVNSGRFDGLTSEEAKNVVIQSLTSLDAGGEKVTYKLRDWVFSRQRYWGEPIPIYFPIEMLTPDGTGNPSQGAAHRIKYDQPIAVDDSELPLKLPPMTNFQPGDDPLGCLARAIDWRYFEKDGRWFARETNTMPQVRLYMYVYLIFCILLLSGYFVESYGFRFTVHSNHSFFFCTFSLQWAGSCWYYLRFADPRNSDALLGPEASSWLPVDLYVGGQEHAVLHLLYARFWHKVLFDIGVVDHPEPFTKLVHQGMILGSDGEKMSKSRGNVINPDDVVKEFGADALRLYEMFMGPLEAVKPWQTGQLSGVVRFRDRVFNLVNRPVSNDAPEGMLLKDMHKTIRKVTQDIDAMGFNTAISNLMIFSNTLSAINGPIPRQSIETLVILLSPFAPHIAEEAWELLGHKDTTIAYVPWPQYDEGLCKDSTATVAIQINGKVRAKLDMEIDLPEAGAYDLAMKQQSVQKFTDGLELKKIIYVPGRILNIVVGK